ncbi:hypothetical protein PO903_10840 [Paenibacillus sp. PK4536]|uniref:Uncharacterized protein n=1 Tax=Paenibacillus nuruki TaxID=1886670 RepID=A0A1E3L8C5_9BACL|nr:MULTISPECIES: hypothetical protein [Paenibacillus]ODP29953.1 hypothetical protein PTI45_00728 [Paenibacillus nuruki]WIM41335.1 hypothetical protein PO903_10840 [Paenibacillus sp. PK4536]
MYNSNFDNNYRKIQITVNGEPVGDGLVLDRITYAPLREEDDKADKATQHNAISSI